MTPARTAALAVVTAAIFSAGYLAWSQPGPAPEVSFSTLSGEKLTTAGLRGKVVLVNFWATSCATCVKEMPELVATYRAYQARGFETVAVAMSYDPPSYVVAFAAQNALPFPVALDLRGEIAQRFGDVRATPTTFLIDRRGRIVKRYLGAPDFTALRALVEAQLAEAG